MASGAAAGALIAGIFGTISAIAVADSQKRASNSANQANKEMTDSVNETNKAIADENLEFQRENLAWQQQVQQTVWDREDTSYQRTASDMRAAGISPLAMQGTNDSGPVVQTSPLQDLFQAQQGFQHVLPQLTTLESLAGVLDTITQVGQRQAEAKFLNEQASAQHAQNVFNDSTEIWRMLGSYSENRSKLYQMLSERDDYDYQNLFGLTSSMTPSERAWTLASYGMGGVPSRKEKLFDNPAGGPGAFPYSVDGANVSQRNYGQPFALGFGATQLGKELLQSATDILGDVLNFKKPYPGKSDNMFDFDYPYPPYGYRR